MSRSNNQTNQFKRSNKRNKNQTIEHLIIYPCKPEHKMRSATIVVLLVVAGSVMVAGQRPGQNGPTGGSGCPVTAFWQGVARARVQAILTMFPNLADEIRNGQLGPNPNNRGNGNNQLPNDMGNLNGNQQGNLNNQQGSNRFPSPFNRMPSNNNNNRLPFNPFGNHNNNNNNNQGGLLDGLNGQQGNNLPSNDLSEGGAEIPSIPLSTVATPTVV